MKLSVLDDVRRTPRPECINAINLLAVTALAMTAFFSSAFAASSEDLHRAFKTVVSQTADRKLVTVWAKKFVRYNLVGDLSWVVKDRVGEFMSSAHSASRLELIQNTTADLMMIYDTKVFEELRNDPERFIAAKVPRAIVDTLSVNAVKSNWGNECQTISWSDLHGDIVGAVIISRSASPKCVTTALYDVFGLNNFDDNPLGMMEMCLLYRATATNVREIESVIDRTKTIEGDCNP